MWKMDELGFKAYPVSSSLPSQVCLEAASVSPWEAASRRMMGPLSTICPCFDHTSSALYASVASCPNSESSENCPESLLFYSKLLFGSWRWVGVGWMLFGVPANCTWLSCVLCQEALGTFCASTDSQGTQFVRKIVFQQVEHFKFGILLLPILTL